MKSGWVGGGFTDEKGGSRKRGGQDPLTPPPLWTRLCGNPSMGNELNRFISVISSYTRLRCQVVNKDVVSYEGEDKVSKVMERKGGRLVVWPKDSQGYKAYDKQIEMIICHLSSLI